MSGTASFPPSGPVTLQRLLPAYLYKQYEDDDDLQTFVAAQNYLAQKFQDDFNHLNLPIWSMLSGALLDWVGAGLYGIRRPVLSLQRAGPSGAGVGPYATFPYNTLEYAGGRLHPANINPVTYINVTDDIYKRILTWHLYKGDGFQFSTRWLKQRIHRFMNGPNGAIEFNDNTYDVSITATGTTFNIAVTQGDIGTVLQYAIADGVLPLPFQFSAVVDPSLPPIISDLALFARLNTTVTIRARATLRASIVARLSVQAGFSGAIFVDRADLHLSATMAAQAGMSGEIIIRRANGSFEYPISGRLSVTAGFTGRLNVRAPMGGVFPGTAG